MKKIMYISGPMRGYVNFNFDAFDEAVVKLKLKGYHPVAPTDIDRLFEGWGSYPPEDCADEHWQVSRFLRRDLIFLLDCTAEANIFMLEGWTASKGARAEKAVAEFIGMTIYYQGVFEPRVLQEVPILLPPK